MFYVSTPWVQPVLWHAWGWNPWSLDNSNQVLHVHQYKLLRKIAPAIVDEYNVKICKISLKIPGIECKQICQILYPITSPECKIDDIYLCLTFHIWGMSSPLITQQHVRDSRIQTCVLQFGWVTNMWVYREENINSKHSLLYQYLKEVFYSSFLY